MNIEVGGTEKKGGRDLWMERENNEERKTEYAEWREGERDIIF